MSDPANAYLYCTSCGAWISAFRLVPIGGRQVVVFRPCGHRGIDADSYADACPTWSPVDGCTCTAPHVREVRS